MLAHKRKIRAGLIAFGLLFAPGVASGANLSLRTIGAQETRLAAIGYRLSAANATACAAPDMMSGLVVHDLGQYPREARAAVSGAFNLRDGVGVLGIVPGSGAARAGLMIDDEILAVGTRAVSEPAVWGARSPSYRRIDDFHRLLSMSLAAGPTGLTVRRAGQIIRLTLTGVAGCGGIVKFVDSGSVNAWSDGRHVVLNRGIVDMAGSDDEVGFVMAHEMAHNILSHSTAGGGQSQAIFGQLFGIASPRNSETQADIAAVSLMRAAGLDPAGGMRFLATAQRRMWWASLSLDHPGFGSRMRNVAQAIARTSVAPYRLARLPDTAPAPGPSRATRNGFFSVPAERVRITARATPTIAGAAYGTAGRPWGRTGCAI